MSAVSQQRPSTHHHAAQQLQQASSDEEDDGFVEPPNFLKNLNLPGVTTTDSLGYRIEALRVYLEN